MLLHKKSRLPSLFSFQEGHHTCVRMNMVRTMWTPLSNGWIRMASLSSWKRMRGSCRRMVSNQKPANSGTFKNNHKKNEMQVLVSRLDTNSYHWAIVVWEVSHLLLQVPSITKIKSDGLNQRHQQQNSHKDELVVVRQGRVLVEMKNKKHL